MDDFTNIKLNVIMMTFLRRETRVHRLLSITRAMCFAASIFSLISSRLFPFFSVDLWYTYSGAPADKS